MSAAESSQFPGHLTTDPALRQEFRATVVACLLPPDSGIPAHVETGRPPFPASDETRPPVRS